mmetsp:Transcript_7848/g.10448  ORF Transcript_7848/g.10448 Transcript_7848/m.10448 type:complete len:618 (+) Transcript_7848:96-1949(+)
MHSFSEGKNILEANLLNSDEENDKEAELLSSGSLPGGLERQPLIAMPESREYDMGSLPPDGFAFSSCSEGSAGDPEMVYEDVSKYLSDDNSSSDWSGEEKDDEDLEDEALGYAPLAASDASSEEAEHTPESKVSCGTKDSDHGQISEQLLYGGLELLSKHFDGGTAQREDEQNVPLGEFAADFSKCVVTETAEICTDKKTPKNKSGVLTSSPADIESTSPHETNAGLKRIEQSTVLQECEVLLVDNSELDHGKTTEPIAPLFVETNCHQQKCNPQISDDYQETIPLDKTVRSAEDQEHQIHFEKCPKATQDASDINLNSRINRNANQNIENDSNMLAFEHDGTVMEHYSGNKSEIESASQQHPLNEYSLSADSGLDEPEVQGKHEIFDDKRTLNESPEVIDDSFRDSNLNDSANIGDPEYDHGFVPIKQESSYIGKRQEYIDEGSDKSGREGDKPPILQEDRSKMEMLGTIAQQTDLIRNELAEQMVEIQKEMNKIKNEINTVKDGAFSDLARGTQAIEEELLGFRHRSGIQKASLPSRHQPYRDKKKVRFREDVKKNDGDGIQPRIRPRKVASDRSAAFFTQTAYMCLMVFLFSIFVPKILENVLNIANNADHDFY